MIQKSQGSDFHGLGDSRVALDSPAPTPAITPRQPPKRAWRCCSQPPGCCVPIADRGRRFAVRADGADSEAPVAVVASLVHAVRSLQRPLRIGQSQASVPMDSVCAKAMQRTDPKAPSVTTEDQPNCPRGTARPLPAAAGRYARRWTGRGCRHWGGGRILCGAPSKDREWGEGMREGEAA